MSQIEIDRVLSQIRALRTQVAPVAGESPAANAASGVASTTSFAAVLRSGLASVNAQQAQARELATAFEQGKPGVDLPQVMLEMQKASISFRAAVEVRNKLVSAYQDVMNMPV